jgi:hypothetical protein
MSRYEYRVCQVQYARITYADGVWQGTMPPNAANSMDSCPELHAYLRKVGEEGWELVSAINQHIAPDMNFQALYFKREKPR